MVKLCSECKQYKNRELFNKNKSRKDGLQTYCRDCASKLNRLNYADNKAKHLSLSRERRKISRHEIRLWFNDYKSQLKCSRCDENHPSTLDFHHLNSSTKKLNVAKMVAQYSKRQIINEIQKCDVLCANCHRKLHYTQRANT